MALYVGPLFLRSPLCFSIVSPWSSMFARPLFLHSPLCLPVDSPWTSMFAHCFSIALYVCSVLPHNPLRLPIVPPVYPMFAQCFPLSSRTVLFHYYPEAQTAMKRHFIEESWERKTGKFVSKTRSKFKPRCSTPFLPATLEEQPWKIGHCTPCIIDITWLRVVCIICITRHNHPPAFFLKQNPNPAGGAKRGCKSRSLNSLPPPTPPTPPPPHPPGSFACQLKGAKVLSVIKCLPSVSPLSCPLWLSIVFP